MEVTFRSDQEYYYSMFGVPTSTVESLTQAQETFNPFSSDTQENISSLYL